MHCSLSVVLALALLVFGCAHPEGDASKEDKDAVTRVRCRTELEYRPGPFGTLGQTNQVQKCEPFEVPTLAPGVPPNTGGTPAPTTQTVPSPTSKVPAAGDQ